MNYWHLSFQEETKLGHVAPTSLLGALFSLAVATRNGEKLTKPPSQREHHISRFAGASAAGLRKIDVCHFLFLSPAAPQHSSPLCARSPRPPPDDPLLAPCFAALAGPLLCHSLLNRCCFLLWGGASVFRWPHLHAACPSPRPRPFIACSQVMGSRSHAGLI